MELKHNLSFEILNTLQTKQETFFLKEALELYVLPQVGQSTLNNNLQDAWEAIVNWLNNPDKQCLLLLGDSGVGKTLFGQWLTCQGFNDKLQGRIPLFIPLLIQNHREQDLIDYYLKKTCEIKDKNQRAWIKQQPLLLILDGFDEIYQKINLYRSNELWRFKDIKIIISCRSQALANVHGYSKFFYPYDHQDKPQPHQLQEYVIAPFSEKNTQAYIEKYVENKKNKLEEILKEAKASVGVLYHNWGVFITKSMTNRFMEYLDDKNLLNMGFVSKWWWYNRLEKYQSDMQKWMYGQTYTECIQKLPGLKALLTSPFVLSIAVQVLPEIVEKYRSKKKLEQLRLARISLYDYFVEQWFARQKKKLVTAEQISDSYPIEELFAKCSKAIASVILQSKDKRSIKLTEEVIVPSVIPFFFDSANPDQVYDTWKQKEYFDNGIDIDGKKIKLSVILSGCPVMQIQKSTYTFLHMSLLDYFAARKLFEGVMIDASIALGYELNEKLLIDEDETLKFLAELVEQDDELKQRLFDVVEESKFEERIETAAANAITILNYAGVSFSQKELRRIRIKGADLSGAIMDNANLQNADLRGSNLSGAWLNHVKLDGALMEKVEFGELSYLMGKKSIHCIAYSPDGCYLAVAGGNRVRLWEFSTGKWIAKLKDHINSVNSVAFSPDGRILASGSGCYGSDDNNLVHLWDIRSLNPLGVSNAHRASVNSVAFSPDGTILASGSGFYMLSEPTDSSVRLWEVATGKFLGELNGHQNGVTSVAFSPDGKILASGSNDTSVRLWDFKNQQSLGALDGHTFPVTSLAFSPDNSCLASGSSDKTVRLWDFKNQKLLYILKAHTNLVKSIAFSPDSSCLASGSDDGSVRLWSTQNQKCLNVLSGHTGNVGSVAFNPDGSCFASSGDMDKSVRFWNTKNQKFFRELKGHTSPICSLVFSPDGSCLASGGSTSLFNGDGDSSVRLWDFKTQKSLGVLTSIFKKGFKSIAFSPDGNCLLAVGNDGVDIWNLKTQRSLGVLKLDYSYRDSKSVVFSPDGSNLASRGIHDFNSLAFSSDGSCLAFGVKDNVCLWDFKNQKSLGVLEGHKSHINSVVFSSDSSCLASGSDDKSVRLWDFKNQKSLDVLEQHTGSINSVVFSPDGSCLAYASVDGSVRIWDFKNHKLLSVLQGSRSVSNLAFSVDGDFLGGSSGYSVYLWDVKTRECLNILELNLTINAITFIKSDEKTYLCVGSGNAIHTFEVKYIESKLEFILYWRIGNDSGLMSKRLTLGGVVGLEQQNDYLLKQREAVGNLSQKKTDDVLQARNQKVPYDPAKPIYDIFSRQRLITPNNVMTTRHVFNLICARGLPNKANLEAGIYLFRDGIPENVYMLVIYNNKEHQSFNLSHHHAIKQNIKNLVWHDNKVIQDEYKIITDEKLKSYITLYCKPIFEYGNAVVTMARKKVNRHAFLVIEYIEDNHYVITRADFFLDQRKKYSERFFLSSGEALVEVCTKSIDDMQYLVGQCAYKSWQITNNQVSMLLANLEADRIKRIKYLNLGDSPLYNKSNEQIHNCITWCEEHLSNIGIDVSQQKFWFDSFAADSLLHLPNEGINANSIQNITTL